MKTVLVVDDDRQWAEEVAAAVVESDELTLVGIAADGEQGKTMFERYKPDAVVLDLVMPVRDGYSFLENVHKGASKIIVVSALSQSNFINKALSLGADNYQLKPCKAEVVIEKILTASKPKRREVSKEERIIEDRITNIFMTVGIPAHIKGYQFLREAIKMAVDNPDVINSITKTLYPEVALRFETSASKVERAIRHAIEVAWNRGKIENINNLFGVRVYNHNEKPTNGEFIALVADKMLLESV